MIPAIAGIIGAYLCGSIPTAYLAGRLLKGIDLREHGSGNLGATNVYRTLGMPAAIVVLVIDAAKGAVPVLVLPRVTGLVPAERWGIAFGVAAILGHVRSVFLLWRGGGKGVATAAGVFGALAPIPLALAFAAFVLMFGVTRIISLGSLAASVVLPVGVALTRGVADPLFIVSVCVAAFVFWTHRSNIQRLRAGVEPRLSRRAG